MLDRISALLAVEQKIRGRPPDERFRARQRYSRSVLDSMKSWAGTDARDALAEIGDGEGPSSIRSLWPMASLANWTAGLFF
jgi:Transposase IS66 family